jgi:hypothetical protein
VIEQVLIDKKEECQTIECQLVRRNLKRVRRWKWAKKVAPPEKKFDPELPLGDNSEHFDFVRQRFLLLQELQDTMATFARPVASTINGVDFNVYSEQEIKALSVKRIHNTPTLDSFNNPVPGGLQDPAMGAWGDHV